jgi:hypothetical protein
MSSAIVCEHLQVNAPMSHAGPMPPSPVMIGPASCSARSKHHLSWDWAPLIGFPNSLGCWVSGATNSFRRKYLTKREQPNHAGGRSLSLLDLFYVDNASLSPQQRIDLCSIFATH